MDFYWLGVNDDALQLGYSLEIQEERSFVEMLRENKLLKSFVLVFMIGIYTHTCAHTYIYTHIQDLTIRKNNISDLISLTIQIYECVSLAFLIQATFNIFLSPKVWTGQGYVKKMKEEVEAERNKTGRRKLVFAILCTVQFLIFTIRGQYKLKWIMNCCYIMKISKDKELFKLKWVQIELFVA